MGLLLDQVKSDDYYQETAPNSNVWDFLGTPTYSWLGDGWFLQNESAQQLNCGDPPNPLCRSFNVQAEFTYGPTGDAFDNFYGQAAMRIQFEGYRGVLN